MRSPPTMFVYLLLLALAIAVSTAAFGIARRMQSSGARVMISASVVDDHVTVNESFDGLEKVTRFRFLAMERMLGIRDIHFNKRNGEEIPFERVYDQESQFTPAYYVPTSSAEVAYASFVVKPEPHQEPSGEFIRFGRCGKETVVLGAHLMLLPENATNVQIDFGRSLENRARRTASCSSEIDSIAKAPFIEGISESARADNWIVSTSNCLAQSERKSLIQGLAYVTNMLRQRLPALARENISISVIPRSVDRIPIVGVSDAHNIVIDVDQYYPRLWIDVLHELFRVRYSSSWLGLGAGELIANDLTLESMNEAGSELEDLARFEQSAMTDDWDLTRPPPTAYEWRESQYTRGWRAKAGLILDLVRRSLSREGKDQEFWKITEECLEGKDFLEILGEVGGQAYRNRVAGWLVAGGFQYSRGFADRTDSCEGTTPEATQVTIGFGSSLLGMLESCGCDKSLEMGGIARRVSVIRALRSQCPDAVVLDLGDYLSNQLVSTLDTTSSLEQRLLVRVYEHIGLDALLAGSAEVARGQSFVAATFRGCSFPVVACNVAGASDIVTRRVLSRFGRRIIIVGYCVSRAVEFPSRVFGDASGGVVVGRDIECIYDAVRDKAKNDIVILGGWFDAPLISQLHERYGDLINIIISSDRSLARAMPQRSGSGDGALLGSTLVLFDGLGDHGFSSVVVSIDENGHPGKAKCTISELSGAVQKDEETQKLIAEFYNDTVRVDGAGDSRLSPIVDPSSDVAFAGRFAGTQSCVGCHASESDQYATTRHQGAYGTLVHIEREHKLSCVRCHVVGFGEPGGWDPLHPRSDLRGVGCESCHGAGGDHVENPRKDNIRRTPRIATCLECHAPEHSPSFSGTIPSRWRSVTHTHEANSR